MLTTKPQAASVDGVADYERQLEVLYARRSAIDALIESLEDYERFREVRTARAELKTA